MTNKTMFVSVLIASLLMLVFINFSTLKQTADLAAGNKFYRKAEFGDAEVYYRRAQAELSFHPVETGLGSSLYQQKRYKEALAEFQRALQLSKDAENLNNAGIAAFKLGKVDLAIDYLKDALLLNHHDKVIQNNFVIIARASKAHSKAIKEAPADDNKDKSSRNDSEENGKSTNQKSDKEQKLSDKNMEELLKQLNVQEEATKGRLSSKKQKLYPISDEYDY